MRFRSVLGTGDDDEYTGFFIDWIEQYSQFIRTDNWYTYTFAQLEFEDDKIMGGVEITLIVLGLGFRARWNYTVTPEAQHIMDQVDQLGKKD